MKKATLSLLSIAVLLAGCNSDNDGDVRIGLPNGHYSITSMEDHDDDAGTAKVEVEKGHFTLLDGTLYSDVFSLGYSEQPGTSLTTSLFPLMMNGGKVKPNSDTALLDLGLKERLPFVFNKKLTYKVVDDKEQLGDDLSALYDVELNYDGTEYKMKSYKTSNVKQAFVKGEWSIQKDPVDRKTDELLAKLKFDDKGEFVKDGSNLLGCEVESGNAVYKENGVFSLELDFMKECTVDNVKLPKGKLKGLLAYVPSKAMEDKDSNEFTYDLMHLSVTSYDVVKGADKVKPEDFFKTFKDLNELEKKGKAIPAE